MIYVHSPVCTTKNGTKYLQHAGVVLLGRTLPTTGWEGLADFIDGVGFDGRAYVADMTDSQEESVESFIDATYAASYQMPTVYTPKNHGGKLCKIAGQMCYQSFGEHRTKNAEGAKYIQNILAQGHGSVLEHANYTLLLYGISRSCTHELVRHRAGCAYSQTSQRYVDAPRFVERPEFLHDPVLHDAFERRIDATYAAYHAMREQLVPTQKGKSGRIQTNQAARAVLTNEVEAPIVMTANLRAWRHMITMRGSQHAEPEIRQLAMSIYGLLSYYEPWVFQDMKFENGGIAPTFHKV